MLPEIALSALQCPACRRDLVDHDDHYVGRSLACRGCSNRYPISASGQPDLRLRTNKICAVKVTLGYPNDAPRPAVRCEPLKADPDARLDYRSVALPESLTSGNRLNRELFSYFPKADAPDQLMLDQGCGAREFAPLCRRTGFEYVGIDYAGDAPDLLGDAHALPFRDETFGFVISFAVLEHLRHPQLAVRELMRVMKPGARLVGTVAFLEPFHMNSFYHCSALGLSNLLTDAGFDVERIAPNMEWDGLRAIASMGLFPRMPWSVSRALIWPLQMMHRLWWKLGHVLDGRDATGESQRAMINTGGFRFVATKPAVTARTVAADRAAERRRVASRRLADSRQLLAASMTHSGRCTPGLDGSS